MQNPYIPYPVVVDKIITEEDLENLKFLIRNRNSYISYNTIKVALDNLETSKDALIIKDLKDIVNHKGRGTITEQSIRDIINKYGN